MSLMRRLFSLMVGGRRERRFSDGIHFSMPHCIRFCLEILDRRVLSMISSMIARSPMQRREAYHSMLHINPPNGWRLNKPPKRRRPAAARHDDATPCVSSTPYRRPSSSVCHPNIFKTEYARRTMGSEWPTAGRRVATHTCTVAHARQVRH